MEDNFYNDGFEEFLQKQVKDHRMFPSDGIWRNINKSLHGDTYWPALTIAAFAFLAAIIAISVYFSPSPDIFASIPSNKIGDASNNQRVSDKGDKSNKSNLLGSISSTNADKTSAASLVQNANNSVAETVVEEILASTNTDEVSAPLHEETQKTKSNMTAVIPQASIPLNFVITSKEIPTNKNQEIAILIPAEPLPLAVDEKADQILQVDNSLEKSAVKNNDSKPVSEDLKPAANHVKELSKNGAQKHRLSYLVYITPSRSYRKLSEELPTDAKVNAGGGPVAQNYILDVNQVVRHKPGTGVEAGISFLYALNNKFKVKSGIQFNVRQYSMEAFQAPMEVATIALRTRNGIDSVNSYAVYRTSSGYTPAEITNRYYQLSFPVGLEWQVVGNKTIQFSVAAGIQPTYLLSRTAYLLTTDYKNYTSNSEFTRNWNINTNLEAFITIKSGDFKWQLGPQFRYQNLPTFITQYPIRENLVDYGIKLGVSKSIQ